MNIIVLVKCVPDTETRIRVAADGRSVDLGDVKLIISPFDEYAVEEALRIREARGGGSVTVVSVGSDRCQPVLRQALAMGADKAVLLSDPAWMVQDGLVTARVLAAAARALGFDLILAGKQGVGNDRSQVGPMVAELLDLPHVGKVIKLELKDGSARAEREIEGGREVFESELPALFACEKGLNEPRYASLKGIMAAKKKPLEVWGADKLQVDLGTGARETWTRLELPPPRPQAKMIGGDAKQAAHELVRLLSEEAKVI